LARREFAGLPDPFGLAADRQEAFPDYVNAPGGLMREWRKRIGRIGYSGFAYFAETLRVLAISRGPLHKGVLMFTKVEANSSASLSARFAGFMRRPASSAKPSSTLRPMATPLATSAGRLARAAEVLAGDYKFKTALVEDALRLNSAALVRHQIEVVREYTELSAMPLEKHKEYKENFMSERHVIRRRGSSRSDPLPTSEFPSWSEILVISSVVIIVVLIASFWHAIVALVAVGGLGVFIWRIKKYVIRLKLSLRAFKISISTLRKRENELESVRVKTSFMSPSDFKKALSSVLRRQCMTISGDF
jgi:hypothetical protein